MNPTQSVSPHMPSLRQTHRVATSLLPVLAASLTVAGTVIAAMETREARAPQAAPTATSADAADGQPDAQGTLAQAPAARRGAREGMSARRYLGTLIGRVLLVALGGALVLALVYAAFATGQVGRAILLTALVLLTLYLTEKVARR